MKRIQKLLSFLLAVTIGIPVMLPTTVQADDSVLEYDAYGNPIIYVSEIANSSYSSSAAAGSKNNPAADIDAAAKIVNSLISSGSNITSATFAVSNEAVTKTDSTVSYNTWTAASKTDGYVGYLTNINGNKRVPGASTTAPLSYSITFTTWDENGNGEKAILPTFDKPNDNTVFYPNGTVIFDNIKLALSAATAGTANCNFSFSNHPFVFTENSEIWHYNGTTFVKGTGSTTAIRMGGYSSTATATQGDGGHYTIYKPDTWGIKTVQTSSYGTGEQTERYMIGKETSITVDGGTLNTLNFYGINSGGYYYWMNYSEPFSIVTKNNATLTTISVPSTYKPFFRGGIWVINNHGSTIPAIPTSNGKTTLGYKSSILTSDSSDLGETFRSTTYPGSSSTNSTVYADYRVVNVMEEDATLELGPQARVVTAPTAEYMYYIYDGKLYAFTKNAEKMTFADNGSYDIYLADSINEIPLPDGTNEDYTWLLESANASGTDLVYAPGTLSGADDVEQLLTNISAEKIVSWEQFYANSVANASKYATVTKASGITGLFPSYVNHVTHQSSDGVTPNEGQSSTNYIDSNGSLGLKGAIATGDTFLVKITARAVNDDGSEGQMRVGVAEGNTGATSLDTLTVPSEWTTFYIPGTSAGNADRVVIRMGQKLQTIQIGHFELYNLGNSISAEVIPNLSVVPSEKEIVKSGTKLISEEAFYTNSAANASKYATVTKVEDGMGLFSKYVEHISHESSDGVTPNASQSSTNYNDASGTLGFKANMTPGDVVLVKITARAANDDNSEGTMRVVVTDGSMTGANNFSDITVPAVWTTFYIPATTASTASVIDRVIIRMGQKLQTIQIAEFELYNFGSDVSADTLPSGRILLEETEELEYPLFSNFISSIDSEEIAVSREDFTVAKMLPAEHITEFSNSENNTITSESMIVFSVALKAEEKTEKIHIKITSDSGNSLADYDYYVPVQWTRIYLPVRTATLGTFSITTDGDVLIGQAKYENKGTDVTFDDIPTMSGMHIIDEYDDVVLTEAESVVASGKATDLVKNGNYVYYLGDDDTYGGAFHIADVTDPENAVVTATIAGLGTTRQIALVDEEHIMITLRQSGTYIVNVKDPYNPYLRTHYDSIEFATGLFVSGDYAFISNREYGVEIVDISDLDNPKYVTKVLCGEAQSCFVLDGILYTGLWAECKVEMYDISDITNPTKLGEAKLNGKGDGMTVYNVGEKTYLYAASGQHTSNLATTTPLSNLGFGQGNGLDIFDVTDPTNPVWLSTSKTDARFFQSGNDYWETEISKDDEGNLYCYLVSTHNGVFVYNVNDPKAPVRLAKLTARIATDSSNYFSFTTNSARTIIMPYDQSEYAQSAIGAVAVEDGEIYLAGVNTGVHYYSNADYLHATEKPETTYVPTGDADTVYNFDAFKDFDNLKTFKAEGVGQIRAATVYGDYIFTAYGDEGIIVLDKNLNQVAQYITDGCCFDVYARDGKLYTAEGFGGAAIYSIDGATITEQWRYAAPTYGRHVRQIRVSPENDYVIILTSQATVEVINISTKKQVLRKGLSNLIYGRGITDLVEDRYVLFYGRSGGTFYVIDFGAEGSRLTTPVCSDAIILKSSGINGLTNGYESLGDTVVAVDNFSNGYFHFGITANSDGTYSISEKSTVSTSPVITGKPAISGNTMVVTQRLTGAISIVDISDVTNPSVNNTVTVAGHPDLAAFYGNTVLLPLGYQGLVSFTYGTNYTVDGDTLTVIAEGEVDFENIEVDVPDGKFFLGWHKSDGTAAKAGELLAKGTVLSAKYCDIDTSYTADTDEVTDLATLGAQIRLRGDTGLRFVAAISKDVVSTVTGLGTNESFLPDADANTCGYGYLVVPKDILDKDGTDIFSSEQTAKVPAVKTFNELDEHTLYTVCIISISPKNYSREFAVAPYIEYRDAQWVSRTAYGEVYDTASLYDVAEIALPDYEEGTEEYEYLSEIVSSIVRVTHDEIVWNQGVVSAEAGYVAGASSTANYYCDITIPENAKYVRFPTFKTTEELKRGSAFYNNGTFISGVYSLNNDGAWTTVEIPENATTFRFGYLQNWKLENSGLDTFKYVEFIGEAIKETEQTMVKLSRPSTGRYNFSVPVNIAPALRDPDGYVEANDYGLLMLPESYTADGEPTRLVIACHGAGTSLTGYQSGTSMIGNYKYLTEMGFAVMDMYGFPPALISAVESTGDKHYGNPSVLECYMNGYNYVMERFNLCDDGVFVYGLSMGGLSSFQIVQSGKIPVLAQVASCPLLDMSRLYLMGSDRREQMTKLFDFEGEAPEFTGDYVSSGEQIDYLIENFDKIVPYSPLLNAVTSGDVKKLTEVMPATRNDLFTETEDVAALYDQLTATHPVPLLLIHNTDDPTVPYSVTNYFYEMLGRGGADVEFATFTSGGHNAWDNGETGTVTGINGVTGEYSETRRLTVEFFKEHNK